MSAPRDLPRGLPGVLPEGEVVLWSGAPDWRRLARSALHVRKLVVYFACLAALVGVSSGSWLAAGRAAAIGAIPVALALLYARLVAGRAVYTMTNRRLVMHVGLALPVTLNLPFARIASVDVLAAPDGSGDLSLTLAGRDRFAFLVLWPHARPWRFSPAQPTLRGLADVARPAQILSRHLAGVHGQLAPWPVDSEGASPAPPPHATLAA